MTNLSEQDFKAKRRAGIGYIAAAAPLALTVWLAIYFAGPIPDGTDTLVGRMVFTLKCCCAAVLLSCHGRQSDRA